MDVYQICNMFKCERCAGVDTPSYEEGSHKRYMIKVHLKITSLCHHKFIFSVQITRILKIIFGRIAALMDLKTVLTDQTSKNLIFAKLHQQHNHQRSHQQPNLRLSQQLNLRLLQPQHLDLVRSRYE